MTLRKLRGPIIVIVLVALLVVGGLWGVKQLTAPPTPVGVEPCSPQPAIELSTEAVSVQVLNGGNTNGLAGDVSDQLSEAGFRVSPPRNVRGSTDETTIRGRSVDDPAVELVAGFFPNAAIEAEGRPDGLVEVIVGDDPPEFNAEATHTVTVPGGEVCVPA